MARLSPRWGTKADGDAIPLWNHTDLRLRVCIAGLFPVLLAVGAASSILEMTPPIGGLALANLRDMFEEAHHGHRHEAIDILEPRGTPVHAVVSGTVRKLFLSKPGGNTIYQFDEMGVYCYYYAHLDRYVEWLREGMWVERGYVIGFVGSTGMARVFEPFFSTKREGLGRWPSRHAGAQNSVLTIQWAEISGPQAEAILNRENGIERNWKELKAFERFFEVANDLGAT
jgi:hypothetical protein